MKINEITLYYELKDPNCNIRTELQKLGRKENWINKHIDKYRTLLSYYLEQYNFSNDYVVIGSEDTRYVRLNCKEFTDTFKTIKIGSERMRWHNRIIKDLHFITSFNYYNPSTSKSVTKIFIPHRYLELGWELAGIVPTTVGGQVITNFKGADYKYKAVLNHQSNILKDLTIESDNAIKAINRYSCDNALTQKQISDDRAMLKKFDYKFYSLSWSPKTHRLYSSFSRISKRLRPFITYKSEKLYEIDVKNSQILLMATLFNNDKLKQYCEDGNFYEKIYNECKERDMKGLVYEEFNKNNFKEHCYRNILFNNAVIEKPKGIQKVFVDLFGLEFIEKRNSFIIKDKNTLSIELQKIESELMIKTVAYNLINTNYKFITLHDAIYTTSSSIFEIQLAIKAAYKTYTGINCQVSEYENPFELI